MTAPSPATPFTAAFFLGHEWRKTDVVKESVTFQDRANTIFTLSILKMYLLHYMVQ